MSEQRPTEELTCTCPGCYSAADVKVLRDGWLFRCSHCDWVYGHPQFMTRRDAQIELARAQGAP